MAIDTSGRITYDDLLDDIIAEFNSPSIIPFIQIGVVKQWSLEACQKLTDRLRIRETRELLLIANQEDYLFADSAVPVTGQGTLGATGITLTGVTAAGTGTISSSQKTITGVGTSFVSQLQVGQAIIVGAQISEIMEIHSNTELLIETAFTTDLSAGTSFNYSTTKFKRQLVVGSTIVASSQTRVIGSITDAYNVVLTTPVSSTISGAAFTIDTVVTEIPTRFHRINTIDRLEGSFRRETTVRDLAFLLQQRVKDEAYIYTNYFQPSLAAEWRDSSGRKFLKVYPVANAHKSIMLYGDIKIKPSSYRSVASSAAMPLDEDYIPMIKDYVIATIYKVYGKDNANFKLYMLSFEDGIVSMQANIPNVERLKVSYE